VTAPGTVDSTEPSPDDDVVVDVVVVVVVDVLAVLVSSVGPFLRGADKDEGTDGGASRPGLGSGTAASFAGEFGEFVEFVEDDKVLGASVWFSGVVWSNGAIWFGVEFAAEVTPPTRLVAPCASAPGVATTAPMMLPGGVINENVVGVPGFRFCRSV